MDLSRLVEVDACTWSLPADAREGRKEARLYGTRELVAAMDDKVLEQIGNVARLPGLVGCALAMPDAHWGYGFPIGGVAAFDPEAGGIVSAGGVGFDISCGIRCLRTGLVEGEVVRAWRTSSPTACSATFPAGVGEEGPLKLSPPELDRVLAGGARWAVREGYGTDADLEYIEDDGCAPGAEPGCVSPLAKSRQRGEMGTLGSGQPLPRGAVGRAHPRRRGRGRLRPRRGAGRGVDPLRLARARPPDRHRLPREPRQGGLAPGDRAARPRARLRADPLARRPSSTSAR